MGVLRAREKADTCPKVDAVNCTTRDREREKLGRRVERQRSPRKVETSFPLSLSPPLSFLSLSLSSILSLSSPQTRVQTLARRPYFF